MVGISTTLDRGAHASNGTAPSRDALPLRCAAWRYRIPLRRPLEGALGVLAVREGLVVRLTSVSGVSGIGEGVAHPFAPAACLAEAWQELCAWSRALGRGDDTARGWLDRSYWCASSNTESRPGFRSPLLRVALETAGRDLEACERGLTLAATLAAVPRESVMVNATVGAGEPEAVAAEVAARVAEGFACVKLKVDPERLEREVQTLRLVRQVVGSGPRLRVDANAACSAEAAIALARRITEFDVEYVEQPVASIADLARVRRATDVRIAADESVESAEAVRALAAAEAADVVVVKPALYGIAEALRIADEARRHGLEVVVTSALDTSVGIVAALHVAAAVPNAPGACGLATAGLLGGDLVQTVPVDHGWMQLPRAPGLGVKLDPCALDRWTVDVLEVEPAAKASTFTHGGAG
jgi:o-succinylbenzoate synthase